MNSMQMEELKEKNIYASVVDTKDIQSIALNTLLKGKDGVSVIDANINDEKHLIITLSDKTKIDAGIIDTDKEIDYNVLQNLPKINDVEIKGNKSLQELGIQPEGNYVQDDNYVHTDNNFTNEEKSKLAELNNYNDTEIKQSIKNLEENKADKSELPDVSQFITKTTSDLINYYLKSETYSKEETDEKFNKIDPTMIYLPEYEMNLSEVLLALLESFNSAIDDLENRKENSDNKIQTISGSSDETQYPSAKAVYDLFNSIVNGEEVSY